jgi:thioredoxin-dependent peroxiredoxin
MTAILLALGSSVGYGVSDFLASRVAKRVPPVLLVLYSQTLQSVVLLVVVLVVRQPYSAAGLAWGTAAGAVGAAGLVAYYQALATGQAAIVAPLASSGAVLPLLVDLARGGSPGPVALAGLVMVLAGIAVISLASQEHDEEAPAPTWHGPPARRRRAAVPRPPVPVLLALVAAVLFGLFFILVDLGSGAAGGGVLWVALGVQLGALPTTLAGALGSRRRRRLGVDDPGPAGSGGPADRAQPLRRRLPGLRGDPRRPGRCRRPGLAGPGGDGPAGPRPHRRASQRPPDRRGRPGRARHPGRVRRPGGRVAVQSDTGPPEEGPPMAKLEEGAQAPEFTLPNQDGTPVSLEDFKGQRVILYFYPADDTPGCTREACQFNDNLAGFQAAGVPVIGISRDDAQSHQRFRNKYGLQFPLLTDADHQVMDAYGAWGEKTRYGQTSIGVLRSTFLVDEQGHIERAWHNVKADGHAAKVLEALGPKV